MVILVRETKVEIYKIVFLKFGRPLQISKGNLERQWNKLECTLRISDIFLGI